ncbi:hypothetical protein P9D57_01105 [Bacillus sonorensis]|uniref:hypothetical protein n=1 Tax=Bacillus sonorensis TaxID=119858 RepID=UPI002DBBAE71|nr:hypothetical protein [Bacillus sonorensis]MEC1437369.1 hypothetical protein [Bacillus sonorensis]
MSNIEKIQSHEIKDIWRIRDGLLIEISKYENLGWIGFSAYKSKIVRGCKGLRMLAHDYLHFKKGDLIYRGSIVKPIGDKNKFKAEVRSSGGSIFGSFTEIEKVLADIHHILNQY